MKKLLALLLAAMMVFSVATLLAGCDDNSKKSASSKEDKDDEEEKKDDDKPTDPSEPSTPSEPTDPTEDDSMLSAMSPRFDEDDYSRFAFIGNVLYEGEQAEFMYAYQTLSDSEVLVYLTESDNQYMYRVELVDDTIEYTRYVTVDGQWYEDTSAGTLAKANEFNTIQEYLKAFQKVGSGFKYKQTGTETHMLGAVNVYEVYDGTELTYTAKVHATYGLIVELKNASGEVIRSLSLINTEMDLEDLLGDVTNTPDTPPAGDGDEFESDIDTDIGGSEPIDPDEGGIVGGGDFDINFG